MNAPALVQHLVAWLQEESAAQAALAQALDGVERALRTSDRAALEEHVRGLARELAAADARAGRRLQIRQACQRLTGLAAGDLTLARVVALAAERGADVDVLERARLDLRARVQDLASRARSLAVLVRHHRGVLAELLAILGRADVADPEVRDGILLDAEA